MAPSDFTKDMIPPDRRWETLTRPGEASDYFGRSPLPSLEDPPHAFSLNNAWWLCEFSRLIYRREKDELGPFADGLTRCEVLRRVGWREARFFNQGGIQYGLFEGPGPDGLISVVVFRGTTGFRNWLIDLDTRPTHWPEGGRVHRGFKEALAVIWADLEKELSAARGVHYYAGHSLGGALALLSASRRMPDAVYAFGAPRVGDTSFSASLPAERVFTIVNGDDPVPLLPPSRKTATFDWAGSPVFLDHGGQVTGMDRNATSPKQNHREPRPLRFSTDPRRWFDPPGFLSDHAPANYRIGIENAMNRGALGHGSSPAGNRKSVLP
ncbi:MAG: lipase family protein [Desulfobacterales bacterium]|jgi:hypothetical protein